MMRLLVIGIALAAPVPGAAAAPIPGDLCTLRAPVVFSQKPKGKGKKLQAELGQSIEVLGVSPKSIKIRAGRAVGFLARSAYTRACAAGTVEEPPSPGDASPAPIPGSTSSPTTPGETLPASPAATRPSGVGDARTVIAVMDLKAPESLPKEQVLAATSAIPEALDKLGAFRAISMQEVKQLLAFEKLKSQLGCDDMACLAEIGGALGANYLVAGTLTPTDRGFSIQLQLVNTQESLVEARVARDAERDNASLLNEVRSAARVLVYRLLAEGSGTLLVRTTEEGASVFVDDALVGVTPTGPLTVPGGRHELRIRKEGFVDFRQEVEIPAGGAETADASLVPSRDFVGAYQSRNASLRLWAWVSTVTAVLAGGSAGGLYYHADRRYYSKEVQPYRSLCNNDDPSCDNAMHTRAVENGHTYNRMIYGVYGLNALAVVAGAAAVYCFVAGEDPDRYTRLSALPSLPADVGFAWIPGPEGGVGVVRGGF